MSSSLQIFVEEALEKGLDFMLVIEADKDIRTRMGFPPSVVKLDPLILTFPALYHEQAGLQCERMGLSCTLSFDALYYCRIPWNTIARIVINHPTESTWPAGWADAAGDETVSPGEPGAPPLPDNVRLFRPRKGGRNSEAPPE